MRNHLIAIQGSASSYHDLAARKFFGENISVIECGSFRDVCERVKNNESDYGVMAIENKVAGSILLNYRLLQEYQLNIIGETYLPVELHLAAVPGTSLRDVREIVSHPMALAQSQLFLSRLKSVLISEYKDTATCAKLVAEEKIPGLAVIAGTAVIRRYGLETLVRDVGDAEHNYTRFYVLSKYPVLVENPDKASLILQTQNVPGALAAVLGTISLNDINLSRIQSIPVPGNSDQYSFHLDLEFQDRLQLDKTLYEIDAHCSGLRVPGIYRRDAIPAEAVYETEDENAALIYD